VVRTSVISNAVSDDVDRSVVVGFEGAVFVSRHFFGDEAVGQTRSDGPFVVSVPALADFVIDGSIDDVSDRLDSINRIDFVFRLGSISATHNRMIFTDIKHLR